MFTSNVFKHAVPHRFQLTKLLRQSESNKQFLKAVSEVRFGICSEETETFIGTLSRNLDSQLAQIATHIFFKKNAVLMFNRSRVEELEGDYTRFDALFEGKGTVVKIQKEISKLNSTPDPNNWLQRTDFLTVIGKI